MTSKYLLTHDLVLLPLETILMFMLKNAVKKKLFEKIRKKNHTRKYVTKFLKFSKDTNYKKKI